MSVIDAGDYAAPRGRLRLGRDALVGGASLLGLVLLTIAVLLQPGATWRMAALVAVGAGIGAVLYRASFGFSSAFRAAIDARDGSGLKVHVVLLGLTALLFMPLLAGGEAFGQKLSGVATPMGVGFVVGAVLFGLGMQIGGGCASGTLFALGGGNAKLAGTLAGFVGGSVLATHHMDFWWGLPTLPPVVLQDRFGLAGGLGVQGLLLLALYLVARALPGRAPAEELNDAGPARSRFWRGPWPLVWGAVGLAVLNLATLLLAGKPWGETSAFALWGAKLVQASGLADPHGWAYWQAPSPFAKSLDRGVLGDVTSVMDGAILLGAGLAAALAGAFRPRWGGSRRAWAGALLGGVVMGYGARLSNGCNIGAYFSAIGAGSLSGWAWMVLAVAGSYLGVKLRPLFDLAVSRPDDGPTC